MYRCDWAVAQADPRWNVYFTHRQDFILAFRNCPVISYSLRYHYYIFSCPLPQWPFPIFFWFILRLHPQFAWNVPEMADSLHVSAGHLQFLYKQKFGISCMDDVIDARLRKAKDLLLYTDQNISEIAGQCGYKNVEHLLSVAFKISATFPGLRFASGILSAYLITASYSTVWFAKVRCIIFSLIF